MPKGRSGVLDSTPTPSCGASVVEPGYDALLRKIGTSAGRGIQPAHSLAFIARATPGSSGRRNDRDLARA